MCHITASMAKTFEREAQKIDPHFVLVGLPTEIGGKEQITVVMYDTKTTRSCYYGSVRHDPDDELGEFNAQMATTLGQLRRLLEQERW